MSKATFMLTIPAFSFVYLMARAAESVPTGSFLLPALVILILVLLNGFFVAAEFAVIGVRATQLEELVEKGNRTAVSALAVLQEPERQYRYIATSQLGVTIASLGLAMYGEPQIAHLLEGTIGKYASPESIHIIGYFISLSILTYLHVVLGEMVPKTLALSDARGMILTLVRPMAIAQAILIWPVRFLNFVGGWLLRLFQIPAAHGQARLLSPEELELLVTESAEGGLINEEQEEMILNIFDFSERLVGQVMTPRTKVQAIPQDMAWERLVPLLVESRHSRFPVYKDDLDHIVGILHIKDLVEAMMKRPSGFDITSILRTAPAVPEDQSIQTLLSAFKIQKMHMAIVLDEFGGMAGVVTLEDLVEEIVGEVRDEFDLEKEPYIEIAPGILELAGSYVVGDLMDDVDLGPEEALPDVDTVGGLVITRLGRPPMVGDEVTYHENVKFKVLAIDGRAVARVRVEFPAPDDGHSPKAEKNDESNPPKTT